MVCLARKRERLNKQPYKSLNFLWQSIVFVIGVPLIGCIAFPIAPLLFCEYVERFRWIPAVVFAFLVIVVSLAYHWFGWWVAIPAGIVILVYAMGVLPVFLRSRTRTAACRAIDFTLLDTKPSYRFIKVIDQNDQYCDFEFELREFTKPTRTECIRVYHDSDRVEKIPDEELWDLGIRPRC